MGKGPLMALIDALERGRALFWSGKTLVEFDADFIPTGQVTMVLDEGDFKSILQLRNNVAIDDLTTFDKLGGMTSEESEALAKLNFDDAEHFFAMFRETGDQHWAKFARWKKMRGRLFKEISAQESRVQDEYERQQSAYELGENDV